METTPSTSPLAATTTRRQKPKAPPPKFSVGEMVDGRYRLTRFLARGGMAEVWLATHESLKQDVAIKFMDHRLVFEGGDALARFRMEAQVSARLGTRTKHIVAVQDAGEHEGRPYLVMEFVPGRTLDDEIEKKGPLGPARLADLLDQAADALSTAHTLGILHRDLKPSNLMLIDEPGSPTMLKVSDFGIAKALSDDLRIDRPKETSEGQLVGSPAYMSPEQIDGKRDLDAATDLWSLAAVAYEALTGRTCFDSASMTDLLITISRARFTPPSHLRPELPKALDAWFLRAFAIVPSARFSSATEMAQSFRAAIAARPAKKRDVPWIAVAAGAAALILVVIFAARSLSRADGPTDSPQPTTSVAVTPASADVAPTTPAPTQTPPAIVPVTAPIEATPSAIVAPVTAPPTAPSVKVGPLQPKASATAATSSKPPVKKGIDPSEIQ